MIAKVLIILILAVAALLVLFIYGTCQSKAFNYRMDYLEFFIENCQTDEASKEFIKSEFTELRCTPEEKPRVMSAFTKFQKKFKSII